MPTDFSKVNWDAMSKLGDTGLPGVMESATKEEPNSYANNLKLATESGISVDAVAPDPKSIESSLNFDKIDWDGMSVRNPRTTDFLTTFDNAVIAQDDIPFLERLENLWSSGDIVNRGISAAFAFHASDPLSTETLEGVGESGALMFQEQFAGAKIFAADTAFDVVRRGMTPAIARNLEQFGIRNREDFDVAHEEFVQGLTAQVEQIQARREEVTPENLNIIQEGVRGGVESLINMAPGFAAMLLTKNAAAMLAPIGVQTGLGSYARARTEGLDPDESYDFAMLDAAIEVGTELLPTSTLQKMITGDATGKLGKEAIRFLIQEMGTEQIATLGQSLNAYVFGLDEQLSQAEGPEQVIDIMLQRAAVTAIATVVAGGTQVGIVSGLSSVLETTTKGQQEQEQAATQEQVALTELNDIAENSNLRQRSPEAFSKFIADLDVDQEGYVFIDSEQVSLYLQENQDQISEDPALMLLAEQVQNSSSSGADVSIPIQDFATVIAATPHFEALRESMTLNQETVSPFRQESMNKETENFVSKMVSEAQENVSEYVEAQNIFLSVRDQLFDSGQLNARSANVAAQLVPAWATVFAKENNISVQEAFERSGLTIEGPQTGEAARLEKEGKTLFQRAKETLFRKEAEPVEKKVFTGPVAPGGVDAAQIIESVKSDGGISLTAQGQVLEADSGFVVSVRSFNVEDLSHAPNLVRATLDNLKNVRRNDLTVGVFDMGDGRFSVDTNVVTQNRDEAIALAKEFDQQSIFDLSSLETIETGGQGLGATEQKFQQFLQREPVPDTTGLDADAVLERPPVEHGVIALDHYSQQPEIEVLDPSKFGTGIRASESQRARDEFWVNRTNHGVATGRAGGYKKESQLGSNRYRTVVPADSMYDIKADPENFKDDRSEATGQNERLNLLEKRVKDAGYLGYWSKHPSLGLVAVTFDPLPTDRVYDLKQPVITKPVEPTEDRLERAREQGFDTSQVLYHGTGSPGLESFSITKVGKLGKGGVYLTNSPDRANTYAKISAVIDRGFEAFPNVIPVYARIKNPITFDKFAPINTDLDHLQSQGYDAVIIKDSFEEGEDEIVIFEPKNIRSINAQFKDPTSARLLAQEDRGYFDDETTTIKLTSAADLTTFVHEFAHFMYDQELKTNGKLLPEINDWFASNINAVATEAGATVSDVNLYLNNGTTGNEETDQSIFVATHEQFARAFEEYLMEGKAPTVELGGVFKTIARWMQQIYAAIRGSMNVNLDDQMRQVFDRLLATEEQIAAAQARVQAAPMFETAEEAGMTDEKFEEYQDQVSTAENTAHEELRNKLISQLTRQATKAWNEEKADITATVRTQLEQTQVYRTIDALRNGEVKLDRATVKEMVGEEVTSKKGTKFIKMPVQLRNMTVTGGKGIHPDQAAAFFDYGSGSEMLADIILADPIKAVSEEAAEIRMKEIHGDILNDGTIEAEADAAVQNEERAKLLLTELRALSKGTAVPNIDRQVIDQIARRQIGKLAYRNIHPGKYRKAELDAKGRAEVALSKGNKEEAAQAKMQQLLNFYLGRAATEARAETLKVVDGMSRYNKKDVQQRIQKAENGYWDQIVKILNRFEFRKAATLKGVDEKNENINIWMRDRMEQDGDALILTPAVLDEGYVTHWKNIPHEQLLGVNDSVKNIEHVARYADKMNVLQEEITFKKLVNNWTAHMEQANTTKFKPQRTTVAEGKKFGEFAMAQMTKIPWLASWLDGGARVGLTHDILVQPFTDALDEEFKLYNEAAKPVVDAMNNRSKADVKRHNTKIFIPEIKDEENDGNLMGHQVLAVALNTGNESNLRKLLLGEGWANPENDAEIVFENPKLQAVLKHMTESDWKLVQLIWDQMDTLYPQLSEVHRKTTGQVPPKVESAPVNTPFGELKGGYYPVKYDAVRSQRAFVNEERLSAQVESMFSTSGSIHASVNASAVNARTGFYDPIRLSLDIVPNHFQETIHFITHHDAVRQVNKLISNKQVRDVISAKLGPEEFAQLKPWLNDLAKDGRDTPNKGFIDRVFGRLRFGVTLGIMGFKASTGIIQISGLSNSIAEVGASNMAQSMRMVLGSPKKMQLAWEFAKENSRVLEHRVNTMDREMRSAFEALEGKRGFVAATQEASMKHIAYVQTFMVDLPSWYAAYIKELDLSGDEQKAYQYADFVIEQVQGSGATKDMAAIMRNQSKTHRIFTMFMTFFSSLWNAQRDTVRGARSKAYSTTTVAAKAMFLITIPVIFEMAMRGELFDEEDEEFDVQRMLTNTALFPIQGIPLLRDAASGVAGDFGYNITPIASVVEKGLEGFRQIAIRGVSDAEITESQVKNASKLAGAALGIPGVNQLWSTGEHLYDVIENGEEFTAREFLFGPKRD